MASKAGRSEKLVTPEFRASFAHLFKPKASQQGGDPKFSITMMFPKSTDISALKKAAELAVRERWGANVPKNLRSPFKDGDTDVLETSGVLRSEKYPEQKGHVVIQASTKTKPGVVDHNVQPIMEESEFYSGCYARATINAFTYGGEGTQQRPGVTFGLHNIQKLREGQPFGFRSRPEDEFEPVVKEDADWGDGETTATSGDSIFG